MYVTFIGRYKNSCSAVQGRFVASLSFIRLLSALLLLLFFLSAAGMASADRYNRGHRHYRGHSHYRSGVSVGVIYGGPYWDPWWYTPLPYYRPYYYPSYYPYYYTPAETTPPVYIERGQEQEAPSDAGVWYYCPDSRTYYPYIKECPGGWQKVPAEPPAPER